MAGTSTRFSCAAPTPWSSYHDPLQESVDQSGCVARPEPGRDFPRDLVWCKLARQTTAFSTLGRGAAPAVLTNELHDMSTHRVPIQTLRPPRGAGPGDPQPPWSSSEEPIELHRAGIVQACTRRPFAMQSSLDSRQGDANRTEHPGFTPHPFPVFQLH